VIHLFRTELQKPDLDDGQLLEILRGKDVQVNPYLILIPMIRLIPILMTRHNLIPIQTICFINDPSDALTAWPSGIVSVCGVVSREIESRLGIHM
jgi:hypothetical protein